MCTVYSVMFLTLIHLIHFYMYCILCSVTFLTLIQGNILINTWEQFGVLIVLGEGLEARGP